MTNPTPEEIAAAAAAKKLEDKKARLRQLRGTTRTALTKSRNRLVGLCNVVPPDKKEIDHEVDRVKELLEKHRSVSNDYQQHLTAEEFMQDIDQDLSYASACNQAFAKVKELFPDPSVSKLVTPFDESFSKTKLPELCLPSFNGELQHWKEFSETFKSIVHENSRLSNVDKFSYLRTKLTGEPLSIVKSYKLTGDQYELAWARLIQRYNRPLTIIGNVMDEVINFQPIRGGDLSKKFRSFTEFSRGAIATLQEHGFVKKQNPMILLSLLQSKLTPYAKEKWSEELQGLLKESSMEEISASLLDSFLDFLEITSVAKEAAAYSGMTTKEEKPEERLDTDRRPRRSNRPHKGATMTFVASSKSSSSQPSSSSVAKGRCAFCNEAHAPADCKAEMEPMVAYKKVKEADLCVVCLQPGHHPMVCPVRKTSKIACVKCNRGNHHTKLCRYQ